jgi:bifunctional oligoribonuclease and PAP phosphatase NrnA
LPWQAFAIHYDEKIAELDETCQMCHDLKRMLLPTLKKSKNILVTSHLSPDFDAVSSALFTTQIIAHNQQKSTVQCVFEDVPPHKLSFLPGFEQIVNKNLWQHIQETTPDLIIITDANAFGRISRTDAADIELWIAKHQVPVVILDHHEVVHEYKTPYFYTHQYSSAAEEVYTTFVDELGLEVYPDYAETVLVGIVSDTGRFLYKNAHHRHTFALVSTLLEAGASIETLNSKTARYQSEEIAIVAELLTNITISDPYNYSYLDDDTVTRLIKSGISPETISAATGMFSNQYLRSIDTATYGFIVMQDPVLGTGHYKGSFRALNDSVDTSVWANALGGGGHKAASGFKFAAHNLSEALAKITHTMG